MNLAQPLFDAVGRLSTQQVRSYLESTGWRRGKRLGNRGEVWTGRGPGGGGEVLLPMRSDAADLSARLREAVLIVADVEARPLETVFRDIADTSFDVVRLSLRGEESRDGSVPMNSGVAVLSQMREILLAAACSAIEPRPTYGPRKPERAVEFVNGVRLGQTEFGSFVVTLRSPVPPASDGDRVLMPDVRPVPYQRDALALLALGLDAARKAVERDPAVVLWTPYVESVGTGLSANLCSALAELIEATTTEPIFAFSWARVRPIHVEVPSHVEFRRTAVQPLRTAAQRFREAAVPGFGGVFGPVTDLHREPNDDFGTAVIEASISGHVSHVRVVLTNDVYEAAIRAHLDRQEVRFEGHLVRRGNIWRLENPRLALGPRLL